MGQGSITLKDGTFLDIEKEFPSCYKNIAVSMSGGVESTALLLILIDRYGNDNIHVVTKKINGRRSWESKNAFKIAKLLGIKDTNIHVLDNDYKGYGVRENYDFMTKARQIINYDAWFSGVNQLLFARTAIVDPNVISINRQQHIYTPFIQLYKRHTIELVCLIKGKDFLQKTFSCTTKSNNHCGSCYCCWERVRGFAELGLKDDSIYDIEWAEMLEQCFYTDKNIVNH